MKPKVHTVITAAGDSQQLFLGAGFEVPKNLIPWKGTEVLVRAVTSYATDWERTSVALNRDECSIWSTQMRLVEACPGVVPIQVSPRFPGALVSALVAGGQAPDDSPLVVAAGDSQISGGVQPFLDKFLSSTADAATIVFPSQNSRWSYVSPGPGAQVRQVAEKRVIGPLATTGVFFFRRAAFFRSAAEWCLVNNARDRGLFFVSTTLNFLIKEGLRVEYSEIARDQYRTWSLPVDFIDERG